MKKQVWFKTMLVALCMVAGPFVQAQEAPADPTPTSVQAVEASPAVSVPSPAVPATVQESPVATPASVSSGWPDVLRAEATQLETQSASTPPAQPLLDLNHVLRRGDSGPNVAALTDALTRRGFLTTTVGSQDQFDADVESAVKAAQRSYGIGDDGKAGPQLALNLNRNPAATAQALRDWASHVQLALDQARQAGASTLIVVNIPSFYLHVLDVQSGEERMESRVIVGMPTRQTPLYLTHIINIKYNPDWNPPPTLVKLGRVYVPPGEDNPLGLLRFSTDNTDNIYLHDTDEHAIFATSNRARSSGCVRVQQWHALAEYLTGQTADELDAHLASGKTTYQRIPHAPVLFSYSLVDQADGQVGVYPDVYSKGALAVGTEVLNADAPTL